LTNGYVSTYDGRLKLRNDLNLITCKGSSTPTNKFNATNRLWNDNYFNAASRIGCVSSIIKDAAYYYIQTKENNNIADLTLDQFYNYYFFISPLYRLDINVPDELCGISLKEMNNLALELKETALKGDRFGNKFDLTFEEAFDYVLIRVLDQTYEGFQNELDTAKEIAKYLPSNCLIIPSIGADDKDSGIDLYVVTKSNKMLLGIQVKPMSFFSGFDKDYIRRAKREHDDKHALFNQKYNVKSFYVVKDTDGKLYNVESKPNVNLKENLQDNLNGLLQEIENRLKM
jgi:hypothetical protein